MRRAVSACTSPDSFFSRSGGAQAAEDTHAISSDVLDLAMEALHINQLPPMSAAAGAVQAQALQD